ncbi:MAG: hypothetical protein IJR68_03610 [Fretibacterium sp.]|nr:hypothetical protein [Fretibacterium sp.]
MQITNKELFYTAMMLKLDHLVNVEYLFPIEENDLRRELNEAKKTLRQKKLLKENAKGEVSLDLALTACAALCANPEDCVVRESDGYYATAYTAAGVYMLLERGDGDDLTAVWFQDRAAFDEYLAEKIGTQDGGE